jgi:hypothetical protein
MQRGTYERPSARSLVGLWRAVFRLFERLLTSYQVSMEAMRWAFALGLRLLLAIQRRVGSRFIRPPILNPGSRRAFGRKQTSRAYRMASRPGRREPVDRPESLWQAGPVDRTARVRSRPKHLPWCSRASTRSRVRG